MQSVLKHRAVGFSEVERRSNWLSLSVWVFVSCSAVAFVVVIWMIFTGWAAEGERFWRTSQTGCLQLSPSPHPRVCAPFLGVKASYKWVSDAPDGGRLTRWHVCNPAICEGGSTMSAARDDARKARKIKIRGLKVVWFRLTTLCMNILQSSVYTCVFLTFPKITLGFLNVSQHQSVLCHLVLRPFSKNFI